MARSLSAAAQTALATKKGTKPVNVVEIDWSNGNTVAYGDKAIPGENVRGSTMSLGEIDSVLDILNSNASDTVDFQLVDTDGEIKNIFDTRRINRVPCRVYQWFESTDYRTDRFLIFSGTISSPVEWQESSRSFTFNAESSLQDREFGFSAEEGEFPDIPDDLVGKPWPVIFGTRQDVPALQVNSAVTGSTLCDVGIVTGKPEHLAADIGRDDCGQGMSISMAFRQISFLNVAAAAWATQDSGKANQLRDQANQLRASSANASGQQTQQVLCGETRRQETVANAEEKGEGCNPIEILGGEDFPQGTPIKIEINGGIFTGTFSGRNFFVSQREHPESQTRTDSAVEFNANTRCETPTPAQFFDFQMEVPPGTGNVQLTPSGKANVIRSNGFIICNKGMVSEPASQDVLQHFWADAGARVTRFGNEPISFIASITPGTVLAVRAWKEFNGERTLVDVPANLYSVSTRNYGPFTATFVTTNKPLSSLEDQGWADQIYVTFQSTIGPNTVDVIEWIVDNYTDFTLDSSSAATVSALVDTKFPFNGAVLDKKNVVEVLREIAYQAKMALWIRDGKVFLKYLPKEEAAVRTITVSDIEFGTVKVSTGNVDDLITKLTGEWTLSIAQAEENGWKRIDVRNNQDLFGDNEETVRWWIHSQPDVIYKAITFWTIRQSFMYKRITFNGFLNLLELEPFDTVTLDLPNYVATGSIKAIVESAVYDSASRNTRVTCLTPVRQGEMTAYSLFWPSDQSAAPGTTRYYPVPGDDETHAGSTGIGRTASGVLPVGDVDIGGGAIRIGGPNVVFNQRADRGDPTPGDGGFTPEDIQLAGAFANVIANGNPNLELGLNFVDPAPPMELPDIPNFSAGIIDIRKTVVVDTQFPGVETTFSTFFSRVSNDNKLWGDTNANWNDGTNQGVFAFQWDTEESKFGAKIAFLK